MRKYKSAVFKHLHEEFTYLHSVGDISDEKLAEFEKDAFKADTSPTSAGTRSPVAASAASPRSHGRSIK